MANAKVETEQCVVSLRSDGGGEYIASELQQFLKDKGTKHETTTPDAPQHNGVGERMNRILLDRVRTMLVDAQLPETYWYDSLRYTAHIHNVTPTRALDGIRPEEAWSGNKPDVSDLKIFGSRFFVHILDPQRGKLSARLLICTFIDLAHQRRAYWAVHRSSRRFIESRGVIFDEGGAPPRFERVTIENNSAPSSVPDSTPRRSPSHRLRNHYLRKCKPHRDLLDRSIRPPTRQLPPQPSCAQNATSPTMTLDTPSRPTGCGRELPNTQAWLARTRPRSQKLGPTPWHDRNCGKPRAKRKGNYSEPWESTR